MPKAAPKTTKASPSKNGKAKPKETNWTLVDVVSRNPDGFSMKVETDDDTLTPVRLKMPLAVARELYDLLGNHIELTAVEEGESTTDTLQSFGKKFTDVHGFTPDTAKIAADYIHGNIGLEEAVAEGVEEQGLADEFLEHLNEALLDPSKVGVKGRAKAKAKPDPIEAGTSPSDALELFGDKFEAAYGKDVRLKISTASIAEDFLEHFGDLEEACCSYIDSEGHSDQFLEELEAVLCDPSKLETDKKTKKNKK